MMHSFWYGDKVEEHEGLAFHYRDGQVLTSRFSKYFEIVAMERYTEMDPDDSIYVIAREVRDT